MTLYDELLASLTKQASTDASIKQGVDSLGDNDLMILANELAALTGDEELANMAKILPVFGSKQVDENIETEQLIANVDPVVAPKEETVEIQAANEEGTEKAEEKEEEAKEEAKEEEEEEAKEEEEVEEDAEEEEQEASAAEILYNILKEGAALEELIEIRASQMVEDMIKTAEDAEVARELTDACAVALTPDPIKAYEYSSQLMDKAKTVASTNNVTLSEAAEAVVADVATTVKTAGFVPSIDMLDKQTSDL